MANLLTKYEAATQLRVSIRTLERWVADGSLKVVKLPSGAVRIDAAEVARLISGGLNATAEATP
jgi:excisionase family DNA binding protein